MGINYQFKEYYGLAVLGELEVRCILLVGMGCVVVFVKGNIFIFMIKKYQEVVL